MKLEQLFESAEYNAFSKYITKKYDVKDFGINEYNDDIELNSIIVKKTDQKQGIGTKIMNELIKFADSKNKRIILHVGLSDPIHGTTSRGRLVKFYKKFGFIENKGRKKDFLITHGMYRESR